MSLDSERVHKLILVFNAEAGALNALIDSTKKLFRINGCSLCSITHGLAGEKGAWRDCREEIGVAVDYLHREEMSREIAELVGNRLPCVLAESAKGVELILGPGELDRCEGNVADFRGMLKHHLAM